MLYSMTGFAKTDFSSPVGHFYWEIRCVNNRYLEPRFYLPEQFAIYESSLREKLREKISRGRCDIGLRFMPVTRQSPLNINEDYANALLQQLNQLSQHSKTSVQTSMFDLLRWPGVLAQTAESNPELQQYIIESFESVLEQLLNDRKREGTQIQQLLLEQCQTIQVHLDNIIDRVPKILPLIRERLLARFEELKSELNEDRLEQEMVYLAQKLDVEEELDRFKTHLKEFNDVLQKGKTVGRRLDFLLQELQREINTLGSKANDKLISLQVVDIKVLIERIREQVQNVE